MGNHSNGSVRSSHRRTVRHRAACTCTCRSCLDAAALEWGVFSIERGNLGWFNTQEDAERDAAMCRRTYPHHFVWVMPWPRVLSGPMPGAPWFDLPEKV